MWYRRLLLCLIAVLPVLALLNVFGQHPTVSAARPPAADLKITAPARLRSGLIFQVRAQVTAHRTIAKPQLVFSPGWWESMSVNSMEPDPSSQSSRNGSVVLTYASFPPGHTPDRVDLLPGQPHERREGALRTSNSTTAPSRLPAFTDP